MNQNFLITELLFLIVALVDGLVAWQFYISRNGILRKLMLVYFCVDLYIFAINFIYFGMIGLGYGVISLMALRFCVLIPKVIIAMRVYYYLRTKK